MNDKKHENRFPLIFGAAAIALLLAIGGYLFWRNDDSVSADDPATTASINASQAVSNAGMSNDQRKATEAVVRSYILTHPEIITEAVEILQQRQIAERLKAGGEAIGRPFYSAQAGNPRGDVTIIEFTDYNCGYCRSSVADIDRLLASDKGIRVVYREVPVLSESSRDAALWALAAAKQGKHGAFHKAMFAAGSADASAIRAAAVRAGLDIATAEKFAASREGVAEVDGNIAMMQQIGFSGTPTFVIGDQLLEGAVGFEALKSAVAKARS